MDTAPNYELPGLRHRSIGLGLVTELSNYIKNKTKSFAKNQVRQIADDIVTSNTPLTQAVKTRVKNLAKVGVGRRRRRRTAKKGWSKGKIVKKRRVGRKRRRRTGGKKKKCYKGTIFS